MSGLRGKLKARVRRSQAATAASPPGAAAVGVSAAPPSPRKREAARLSDKKRPRDAGADADADARGAAPAPKRKLTELQARMKTKLQGAQFRWLNERLYTCTGEEALRMMRDEPEKFELYHEGFRAQAEKWPTNPLDTYIRFARRNPGLVIGDFGCGDARLAESVPNVVHSFDLVARNERVVACDISRVPLPDAALDAAVFSLSLMGTNYLDFVREARRTLKPGGALLVAEVESRFDGRHDAFVRAVCALGFRHVATKPLARMFVMFDFERLADGAAAQLRKKKQRRRKKQGGAGEAAAGAAGHAARPSLAPAPELKPCLYKRR